MSPAQSCETKVEDSEYREIIRSFQAAISEEQRREAIDNLERIAEAGHAAAQCDFAYLLLKGNGVDEDAERGVNFLRSAANQGHATAMFNLGILMMNTDSPENWKEAAQWYKLSAEMGVASAAYNYGLCCFEGKGVEVSQEEAVRWFNAGALSGMAEAQYSLGLCYLNGYGIEQNVTKALEQFDMAANQGHSSAHYNLGLVYLQGELVEKDLKRAVAHLEVAREAGHEMAGKLLEPNNTAEETTTASAEGSQDNSESQH